MAGIDGRLLPKLLQRVDVRLVSFAAASIGDIGVLNVLVVRGKMRYKTACEVLLRGFEEKWFDAIAWALKYLPKPPEIEYVHPDVYASDALPNDFSFFSGFTVVLPWGFEATIAPFGGAGTPELYKLFFDLWNPRNLWPTQKLVRKIRSGFRISREFSNRAPVDSGRNMLYPTPDIEWESRTTTLLHPETIYPLINLVAAAAKLSPEDVLQETRRFLVADPYWIGSVVKHEPFYCVWLAAYFGFPVLFELFEDAGGLLNWGATFAYYGLKELARGRPPRPGYPLLDEGVELIREERRKLGEDSAGVDSDLFELSEVEAYTIETNIKAFLWLIRDVAPQMDKNEVRNIVHWMRSRSNSESHSHGRLTRNAVEIETLFASVSILENYLARVTRDGAVPDLGPAWELVRP